MKKIAENKRYGLLGDYVNSLVLGFRDFEGNRMSLFADTGILHVLSISGTHINLIIIFITLFFSFLGIPKKKINLMLFFILSLYLFLAGESIPIYRALITEFLMITTKYKDRLYCTKITFILFLIYNPFLLLSTSFQMTFFITFVIIQISKIKINNNKNVIYSFLLYFSMLPLTLPLNNGVNFLSPLANLFLIPIFTLVLLPLSFLFFFSIKNFIIIFFLEVVIFFLEYVLNIIDVFTFTLGNLTTIFYLIYFYILYKLLKTLNYKFLYYLIFFILIFIPNLNFFGSISFIDVGQGNSMLIKLPFTGENILIDAGPKSSSEELLKHLKYNGVTKIDHFFVTHLHEDHYGGYSTLKKNLKIKNIYTAKKVNNIKTQILETGDQVRIGSVLLEILSADTGDENENNNGLVMCLHINDHKLLIMGDAEEKIESQVASKFNQDIDLLLVGHHGSRTSSKESFIKKIKPKLSIISFSKNNKFGHPHKETISTLKKYDSKILTTQDDKNLVFYFI